jgi:hypothetical protein
MPSEHPSDAASAGESSAGNRNRPRSPARPRSPRRHEFEAAAHCQRTALRADKRRAHPRKRPRPADTSVRPSGNADSAVGSNHYRPDPKLRPLRCSFLDIVDPPSERHRAQADDDPRTTAYGIGSVDPGELLEDLPETVHISGRNRLAGYRQPNRRYSKSIAQRADGIRIVPFLSPSHFRADAGTHECIGSLFDRRGPVTVRARRLGGRRLRGPQGAKGTEGSGWKSWNHPHEVPSFCVSVGRLVPPSFASRFRPS